MDNKTHIRKLIDGMMENHDILMCGLFKEKSGSNLLKIRFDDLPGGGTRNSNIHFRRKSDKQFDRDITRPSNTKSKTKDLSSDHPSSRTRSKTENLRCDDSSYEHQSLFDGVASPVSCIGSDASCKSPDVQCYSPDPLVHADINSHNASLTDFHRVESIPAPWHWVDPIPVQNLNLISFEDCVEFQSDIEIVNGCLSSDVQPSEFMFCETNTQTISVSAPVEIHEDPLVNNQNASECAAASVAQGGHCLSETSDSKPKLSAKQEALRRLIGGIIRPISQEYFPDKSDVEETQAEPRQKPKKKKKKKKPKSDR